ncbi:MAG TPA: FMN-binding glutamate synthase family protein, partial [Acidimicrobiales bacterium]
VVVDKAELTAYRRRHPMTVVAEPGESTNDAEFRYHDSTPHLTPEEPAVARIHMLARYGLDKVGHDGPVAAMGVPRSMLPSWDSLQVLAAQLARFPLLEHETVEADVTIGPRAAKPLHLELPIFVSDMSYGALSQEAKTALGLGADRAGTGICSGEGGMLPEEHDANRRYFYELASGRFGWDPALLAGVQAVHLKLGQGAKTGTGGHLPGSKVVGRIAEVRGLPEGQTAVSPARFPDWKDLGDAKALVEELRAAGNGIPVGVKMSAQHIEDDIDAALALGIDYIILDGRGGGTGAAPLLFRDQISVPTIAAIPRARAHLDRVGATDITLVATGGIREAPDIFKALALGADAVALANSAIQAIGCVGMRACHTDNCPVGIATQKPHLRARLMVDDAADRLARFLLSTTALVKVLTGAAGHHHVNELSASDLTTWDREMAALTGVAYGGMVPVDGASR